MNESIREFVTQLTNEQLFAVWFLIGAALVFWMQAGFAMVEAGFTRAKNTGNIIMKNLMDFCIGTVTFILIGFGLLMGEDLVVTNGDQTDTIYEGLKQGLSFNKALESRCFEPDAPNFTPRISAMITFVDGDFSYQMSILKSIDEKGSDCARYGFSYPSVPGLGHFIHTYVQDGDPIPTFQGEPERIAIPDDIDAFTESIWKGLNEDNKISLYVTYTDLETMTEEHRLINKNK